MGWIRQIEPSIWGWEVRLTLAATNTTLLLSTRSHAQSSFTDMLPNVSSNSTSPFTCFLSGLDEAEAVFRTDTRSSTLSSAYIVSAVRTRSNSSLLPCKSSARPAQWPYVNSSEILWSERSRLKASLTEGVMLRCPAVLRSGKTASTSDASSAACSDSGGK